MNETITQLYWAQTYGNMGSGMAYFLLALFSSQAAHTQQQKNEQQKHLSGVVLWEIYDDDVFSPFRIFLRCLCRHIRQK